MKQPTHVPSVEMDRYSLKGDGVTYFDVTCRYLRTYWDTISNT
jgi:hypothetical protein